MAMAAAVAVRGSRGSCGCVGVSVFVCKWVILTGRAVGFWINGRSVTRPGQLIWINVRSVAVMFVCYWVILRGREV